MAAGTQPAVRPKVVRDPLDERVRRRTASLDPIFNPSSVVVIADGAAPHPAAGTILSTMSKSGFAGKLFAVGLDDTALALGVESCPSVKAIPSEMDLAVVTTPANRLLDVLGQCAMVGVKGTIVTIPCRGEDGPRAELYSGVQQMLRGSRMRVLGPNCSVLMNPSLGLNASCAAPLPVGGTIAFISQSGALCHAILEWSFRGIVGFSAFVSIGGMIDVDWGDLIDHFGADPNTRSIIVFMESIGNARSFLSAAREVALTIRPIQAEDEPLMIKFHERLSDHSVYLRYFQMIGLSQRTQHDRLTRVCFIDYDREMALVAEHRDLLTDERRIVGLGNLGRARGSNEGEVAAVVSDDYQGHGLGTELMRRLVQVARAEKMERVVGSTMLENKPTIAMLKRVGFQVRVNFKDQVVEGEINL